MKSILVKGTLQQSFYKNKIEVKVGKILNQKNLTRREEKYQESNTTVLKGRPAVIDLFMTAICMSIFDKPDFAFRSRLRGNIPSLPDMIAVIY